MSSAQSPGMLIDSGRPEQMEFDKFACITIQGGGVYGLALLGQLEAVSQRGFLPVAWPELQPAPLSRHYFGPG
jgi:hypothetical protein